MTSIPVRGVKIGKDGKLVKKPPRMAPVLAAAKHKQAAREEKAWRLAQQRARDLRETGTTRIGPKARGKA